MKSPTRHLGFIVAASAVTLLATSAHAQVFTGTVSNDYGTAGNWDSNTVPNTSAGGHAIISNGSSVTYNPGGDFVVSNGGELEVSNGTWTQIGSNNWIQLAGTGTILVDGGTFNQGSAGNTPFNIGGTGNAFTITSGAANFNSSLASTSAGVTYNFNGGITTFAGEVDYNSLNNIIVDGGVLNATLLTGVNAGGASNLLVEAGTINLSSGFGIYGANAANPVNFSLGSTGSINFEATDAATVLGFINSGAITYNGAVDTGNIDFLVTPTSATSSLLTAVVAAPEPSTYVMLGLGLAVLIVGVRRRSTRA